MPVYQKEWTQSEAILDMLDTEMPVDGSLAVSVTVATWRKANQVHKWFVDTIQNGVDDCGTYYLELEQLEPLRALCQKALDQPALASTLLPTQSGFFFGSYEYDEWYWEDIKGTIAQLDWVIDTHTEYQGYEYSSSW